MDDQVIAALGQKTYVEIHMPPGKHVLSAHGTQFPKSEKVTFDIPEHGRLYYETRPNGANNGAAAASAVDPTFVGVAIASMFMRPFLLRPSSEEEFRERLDLLERVEVASGPAGKSR